jgi:hypothetical protein
LGSLPDIEFYSENDPDTTLYVSTIFWCNAFLNISAAFDVWDDPKLLMSLLYIIGRVFEERRDVRLFAPGSLYSLSDPKDFELVASLDLVCSNYCAIWFLLGSLFSSLKVTLLTILVSSFFFYGLCRLKRRLMRVLLSSAYEARVLSLSISLPKWERMRL